MELWMQQQQREHDEEKKKVQALDTLWAITHLPPNWEEWTDPVQAKDQDEERDGKN